MDTEEMNEFSMDGFWIAPAYEAQVRQAHSVASEIARQITPHLGHWRAVPSVVTAVACELCPDEMNALYDTLGSPDSEYADVLVSLLRDTCEDKKRALFRLDEVVSERLATEGTVSGVLMWAVASLSAYTTQPREGLNSTLALQVNRAAREETASTSLTGLTGTDPQPIALRQRRKRRDPNSPLTPQEAASRLNLGVSTIYRWAEAGAIPSLRIGPTKRSLRFEPKAIDKYLQDARVSLSGRPLKKYKDESDDA